MPETQIEKTIRLMKAKVLKKHKCGPEDIIFGQPALGPKVKTGHRTAKIRYAYRKRLKGTVSYNGKTITVTQGGR
jgi:hypothetical protein